MAAKGKAFKLPSLTHGSCLQQPKPAYSRHASHTRHKSDSTIASTYSFRTRSSADPDGTENTAEKAAESLALLCDQFKATHICRYRKIRMANHVIIACLVRKTLRQRLSIQREFKQLYSSELATRLKESLGPEYAGIIDGLLLSPYSKLAMELHQFVEDLDPFALMDKLLLSAKRSLICACAEYKKQFGIPLIADVHRSFGDPRVSRLLTALVRGLLWPAAADFAADAVAVAAREAESQETTLLEGTGVLLVGLQKYGPQFFVSVADAYAAANAGGSLLQCVRATYSAGVYLLVRRLLDPGEGVARVRELAGRVERLLPAGACVSRELVHQLVLLTESPPVLNAVSRQLLITRGASLRDLIMHQVCSRDCAEVLSSILAAGSDRGGGWAGARAH